MIIIIFIIIYRTNSVEFFFQSILTRWLSSNAPDSEDYAAFFPLLLKVTFFCAKVHFHCGVSPRVQDLPGNNADDRHPERQKEKKYVKSNSPQKYDFSTISVQLLQM